MTTSPQRYGERGAIYRKDGESWIITVCGESWNRSIYLDWILAFLSVLCVSGVRNPGQFPHGFERLVKKRLTWPNKMNMLKA